jgi:hypothetical protein
MAIMNAMRTTAARLVTVAAVTFSAGAAAAATGPGGGLFSVRCLPSHTSADDPIVYPGMPGAAHLHQFFANRSTSAFSTYLSMIQAATSCELAADTAAYWIPMLLTPSGTPVPATTTLVYYRTPRRAPAEPFPPDLRMVTGGDTLLPTVLEDGRPDVSWSCSDNGPFFPQPSDCGDRALKAQIHFPSCWDGVRLDSPDHRAHMAFPTGGVCGDSHPVRLPKLSLSIAYRVRDATGYGLSSDHADMPSGTTLHADFWQTWRDEVQRFLVEQCVNMGRSCDRMTDNRVRAMGVLP